MATPSSTYRLQIRAGFDLREAAGLVGYLAELGVDAVYVSPLLQATAGSDHGYDVVDVTGIDPARGGSEGWSDLVSAARAAGLKLVVDIVPNHVGVAAAEQNPAWWDLLRLGADSPYAAWFDVDWTDGRIRLPVLGDDADLSRDLTLEDGELRYFEHRFPIAPNTGSGSPQEVHDRQHYELVNFRRADTDQNYRRFFAVTTLAGLRVEDEPVFEATHAEILRWVREDAVDGLRVDHPDGLADPGGYLARLRARAGDVWLTVEKILEPGEELPVQWPVDGTTGYDALAEVGPLFVDPAAEGRFDRLYEELTGDRRDFAAHVRAGKRMIATTILQAEITRLARLIPEVPDAEPALRELIVAFPVYRSYLPLGAEYLQAAADRVRKRHPQLAGAVDALWPRLTDPDDELCVRFQQTSGAVMAKGVEDTAYYRYSRFIALNEVGGDPARFGSGIEEFHAAQSVRQSRASRSMTTLSTHDTKRGEDVRARLAVLAELPDEWALLARRLHQQVPVPNAAFGYLLAQTLVGVGYIDRARLHAYAEKAMREAADGTGWIDPDAGFETAVHAAIDTAYDDAGIRATVEEFIRRIAPFGWTNALGQKLVQLTMPGVPDTYQGTELWEDSLVDPDNRRPVDYSARTAMLRSLGTPPPVDATGTAKLWIVAHALRLRRERAFSGYTPIRAGGPAAEHAVAFDRGGVVTVATRLPVGLARIGGWTGTALPLEGSYRDVLTGRVHSGPVDLDDLLATYPVALLDRSAD